MTNVVAEPYIDVKDKACVDGRPVYCPAAQAACPDCLCAPNWPTCAC